MSAPDEPGRRLGMVTLESTARTTASGNHIEAVRGALDRSFDVTVFGSASDRSVVRYATVARGLFRARRSIDLLYVRHHPLAWFFVAPLRRRGLPVVLEVNGPPADIGGRHRWATPLAPILRRLHDRMIADADAFSVPTEGMAEVLAASAPGVDCSVIPAGFDGEVFRADVVDEAPHDRPYVAFVGANVSWQGVDVLEDAVRSTEWPEGVDLVLIGDFPPRPPATGDRGTVVTPGRLPPAEVARYLRHAVASVSAKTYRAVDGSSSIDVGQAPLKVFESMACATPCVVTDVPVQNRLVREHEFGIVVPVGDAPAIGRAISTYVSDPERRRRDGERALVAAETYSWESLADETRSLVENVARR